MARSQVHVSTHTRRRMALWLDGAGGLPVHGIWQAQQAPEPGLQDGIRAGPENADLDARGPLPARGIGQPVAMSELRTDECACDVDRTEPAEAECGSVLRLPGVTLFVRTAIV